MDNTNTVVNRLNHRFTLDEYLYEMNNREQTLKVQPNPNDFNDQLYCRKYAHNLPPLISMKSKPFGWDRVNVKGDDNRRCVFFGWDNITQHELEGI